MVSDFQISICSLIFYSSFRYPFPTACRTLHECPRGTSNTTYLNLTSYSSLFSYIQNKLLYCHFCLFVCLCHYLCLNYSHFCLKGHSDVIYKAFPNQPTWHSLLSLEFYYMYTDFMKRSLL